MTDARHPDRWLMDRRIQRLTAEQYRAYSMSLMYSVSNRTDGHLTAEDLEAIPHFGGSSRAEGLVKAGLWEVDDSGWYIVDYMGTQSSRAQMEAAEAARIKERERGASRRAAKTCNPVDGPMDDRKLESEKRNPADGRVDDTGQDRKGKDRTGQALYSNQSQTKSQEIKREGGSAEAVAVVGALALDPYAWPVDKYGIECREICESEDWQTVPAVVAANGWSELQARNFLGAAYPGRRF